MRIEADKCLRFGVAAEAFLARRGFWILAAFAVLYYALYFDTGLTLTGEQGSNALISMRILAGERPFVDMFTGYNLLWFYPISGIFSLFGPHWLAMRIYFLLLAVVTALLGYSLVRRVTGQAWLAFIAGIFMVLMPGAIFRNYMGFIGVLAASALVRAYVLDMGSARRQIAWMGLAGAAMSVCFLIRVEPSLLLAIVWLGLALLYPVGVRGEFLARLRTAALGTLLGTIVFAALHAPFVAHSYARGFGSQFTGQYTQYISLLRWELEREWTHWLGDRGNGESARDDAALSRKISAVEKSAVAAETDHKAEASGRDGRRPRPPLGAIFTGGGIYFLAAALWMPVLVAPVLVLTGSVLLLLALLAGDAAGKTRALVVLATTGSALSLFPQYFFFRPDSVHLNEFLVAFWPASLCSAWVILQSARISGLFAARLWACLIAGLVALLFIVSFNALFGRDGSGSIMASRGADTPFVALNGVHAKVKASEIADWQGLRDAVLEHSDRGQFVVTYPYVPIVNVMCDRPTYQWNLYVDNATASPSFQDREGLTLREKKPAVIVINNRAINKTEVSRFSNWASQLCTRIREDYTRVGTFFKDVEVYALGPAGSDAASRPSGSP